MSVGGSDDEPMMDINTTPLIDVMLVLLIMFIITIPLQTHAVKLDLPQDQPNTSRRRSIRSRTRSSSRLRTRCFGTAADRSDDAQAVSRRHPDDEPGAELHLQPEAMARYELVDEVLAVTKRARVEKMGFVGNEAYGTF
jgi:biopolymer transport protein ExbD